MLPGHSLPVSPIARLFLELCNTSSVVGDGHKAHDGAFARQTTEFVWNWEILFFIKFQVKKGIVRNGFLVDVRKIAEQSSHRRLYSEYYYTFYFDEQRANDIHSWNWLTLVTNASERNGIEFDLCMSTRK